jgi:hypothetical protein
MLIPFLGMTGLLTLAAAAGAGGDSVASEWQALKAKANLIRQDDAMLRWRDIPWYTDANEGIKVAREEKRPVLLWVTGDDPLGRC